MLGGNKREDALTGAFRRTRAQTCSSREWMSTPEHRRRRRHRRLQNNASSAWRAVLSTLRGLGWVQLRGRTDFYSHFSHKFMSRSPHRRPSADATRSREKSALVTLSFSSTAMALPVVNINIDYEAEKGMLFFLRFIRSSGRTHPVRRQDHQFSLDVCRRGPLPRPRRPRP